MKEQVVAFFGPRGSHTELALKEHVAPLASLPCHSIAEVFLRVASGAAEAGLVPIENLLQGPVAETLDLLFEYKNRIYIEQSYVSQIVHCLGLLPGTVPLSERQRKITQIYSHEQALRQCAKYLLNKFPSAELCPAASTGSAAAMVREKSMTEAAVIAASSTLTAHGLTVLDEDISDVSENKTRFVLLRAGDVTKLIAAGGDVPPGSAAQPPSTTSIVIDPGRDRQGLLFEILEVISIKHRVNLSSIHSRPDTRGGFVFHLDLEGSVRENRIRECLRALEQYCLDSTGQSAEITICGSYPRPQFHTPPFRRIGIIGGEGTMGRWFQSFFRAAGLEVMVCDKHAGLSIEEIAGQAEVILLSVPMSEAEAIGRTVCGHARAGQLLVENCSIKSCIIPPLLHACPAGVEVLGLHTMFGGDAASIRGENVIITKTERSAAKAKAFEDLLYKHGAKITHASAEEHDKRVAVVQALLHFCAVALAKTMEQSFSDLGTLEPFSTPNSRAAMQIIRRVVCQSESLLKDLQTLNAQYPSTRQEFLAVVLRLSASLETGDSAPLLETVKDCRKFLGC